MTRGERKNKARPLGDLGDEYGGASYLNPRNAVFGENLHSRSNQSDLHYDH